MQRRGNERRPTRYLPEIERIRDAVRPRVTLRQRLQRPVVLDELEDRREVEGRVVDEAALRVRADQQRRGAEAVAVAVHLRRLDVVVPAAPVVVGPGERRTLPRRAPRELVDQRADEALAGLD